MSKETRPKSALSAAKKCSTSVSKPKTTVEHDIIQAATQLLDLDGAMRGHLSRKSVSSQTAEGAILWFKVLEQMRTNEALLKEKLREALRGQ